MLTQHLICVGWWLRSYGTLLSFFKKINLFIYLFLAALGLYLFYYLFILLFKFIYFCCARAFSSCGERGLLFVVVRGLLIAVTSLVAEHGL